MDENGKLLEKLNRELEISPDNPELLDKRAELFYKTGKYGEAINDLNRLLKLKPGDKGVQVRIDLIQTILRYTNTDIYASTNTNMDPWLE